MVPVAVVCVCLTPTLASEVQDTGSPKPAIITREKAYQLLELAKLAAEHEMFDLAHQCVQTALQKGPPVIPIEISQQTSRRTSRRQNEQVKMAREISSRLSQLSKQLQKSRASAGFCYDLFHDVVFPSLKPGRICPYGSKASEESAGKLLVFWSIRAQKFEQLKSEIHALEPAPHQRDSRDLLLKLTKKVPLQLPGELLLDALNNLFQ